MTATTMTATTTTVKQEPPKVRAPSIWRHTDGRLHRVIMLINVDTKHPDRYPVQVVTLGMCGANRSRPLADWHRSYTWVKDLAPARTIEDVAMALLAAKAEVAELHSELASLSKHDDWQHHERHRLEQEVKELRQAVAEKSRS